MHGDECVMCSAPFVFSLRTICAERPHMMCEASVHSQKAAERFTIVYTSRSRLLRVSLVWKIVIVPQNFVFLLNNYQSESSAKKVNNQSRRKVEETQCFNPNHSLDHNTYISYYYHNCFLTSFIFLSAS